MPQVQRVGQRTQFDERAGGEEPVGRRLPGIRRQVRRRQDEEQGGDDGHQCQRAGELPHAVDECTARQDRHDGDEAQQLAQPHRPPRARHQRTDQYAEQQFPGAGEGVVVGNRLKIEVGIDRVPEGSRGQDRDHHDQHGTDVSAERLAQ
ncbi:Uncharacterised protein [Mycobacteroides abscessus subsp. massiliense]|nr:Uncharacterised protein [Mycobacteroides abscessus subsp. massiliense]